MEYYYHPQNTSDLIDAIEAANNHPNDAHKITLKSNQLYSMSTVQDTDYNGASGLPAIDSNVHIIGNGAILKRANTAPDFRILRIEPNKIVTIEGVKFLNGKLSMALAHGGAIKNQGNLTLINTIFEGNQAGPDPDGPGSGYGGAILNMGTLTITSSNLENNHANTEGGAIYNDVSSSLNLTNLIIRGNRAYKGAGFYSRGEVVAEGCAFLANESTNWGGAMAITGNIASITNCSIVGNRSTSRGAAAYLEDREAFHTVTFTKCRIYDNINVYYKGYVFYNDNADVTVNARNNYWGTEDGPSGNPDDYNPSGSGDSVSPGVWVYPFIESDEIKHDKGAGGGRNPGKGKGGGGRRGKDDITDCMRDDSSENPIGLRDGEKRLVETDLWVETPSDSLTFTRYYRQSKQFDPHFQFMGLGWTHNHAFDLVLSGTTPNRTAAVGTASGGTLVLTETSQDHFDAEAGAYSSMDIVDNGGQNEYILTLKNKTIYTFDDSFKLISRQMSNNQILSYTYDGSDQLTSVTDEHGRGLKFAYDSGYLVRVGDHNANLTPGSLSGRYVEFVYQNAKAKSTSEGDILATDKLLHEVYDVHQASKPSIDKDAWTYVYYGQDSGETDTAQYNWLIERVSPTPETGTAPISLERIQYLGNQSSIIAEQSDSETKVSTEFNLVPGHAYTVEADVTINSGTVKMSVTGVTDFDATSSTSGVISTTISSWSGDAMTRRHQIIVEKVGTAIFTVNSITVTETNPAYHTLIQERGIVGTADPLQSTTFIIQPNGRAETLENQAGYESTHLFDRGLPIGQAVKLSEDETLVTTKPLNDVFRSEVNEDANGHVTRLAWSADGSQLQSVTNALAQSTGFSYDTQGRLIQSTDAQGHLTEYAYNDSTVPRQPTSIQVKDEVDTLLRHQVFTYDSKGRVLSDTLLDPDDGITELQRTEYVYGTSGNSAGLLESVKVIDVKSTATQKPSLYDTTYTYDEVGRLIQTQQSSLFGSCEKSYTVYDEAGNVVASICHYDPMGYPAPTTAQEAVDLSENVDDSTKNHVTIHEYDALDRRIATTTRAGTDFDKTARTVLDALGRSRLTIQNYKSQGASTPHTWIWESGAWKQSSGGADIEHGPELNQNIISEVAYNARGLVRMRRDVLGNVTLYGYDAANRLIKTVQNAATPEYNNDFGGDMALENYSEDTLIQDQDIITTQSYDDAGNVIRTQDAAGRVTLTGFDALNRAIRVIRNASQPDYDMVADPTLAEYDLTTTLAKNPDLDHVSTTDYDNLGRVVRTQTLVENRDDEVWDTTLYGYDALGRQVRTIQHAASPDGIYLADLSDYNLSTNPDEDMVSETVYDTQGRVRYTSDVDDNTHWQVFDEFNHVVKSIQNASYVSESESPTPDDETYIPSTEADLDLISETIYDDSEGYKDKVVETIDVLGNVTRFVYDPDTHRQIRTVQNYTASSDPADWVYENSVWKQSSGGANVDHGSDNAENLITGTEYDEEGRVLKTYDTRYNITLYGYDSSGRRVRTIQNASNPDYDTSTDAALVNYQSNDPDDDQDRVTQTVYDLAGRVAQTIDSANRVTVHIYDRLGRRVRSVSNYVAQGSSDPKDWVFELISWKDGAGNYIQFGDDTDENYISDTVYTKAGQVENTRNTEGTVTAFSYDAAGRRRETTQAFDTSIATTQYTCYNKAGWVLRTIQNWIDDTTSPDAWDAQGDWVFAPSTHGTNKDENLITVFSYDKASRRISTTNPAGDTSLTTYFKNGQVETMTDPEDFVTLYRYDALHRRTLVVQGYVAQATPPEQWEWVTDHWEDGDETTPATIQHGPNNDENIIVQVTYDKSGRTLSLRDPNGHETTYDHDKLSRRILLTNPANVEWNTEYADDGQKTTITMTYPGLSSGGTYNVQRAFDRLGRLISIQYDNDQVNTPDVQFAYDVAGNRIAMTEFGGAGFTSPVRQTQYAYDRRNRLIRAGFDVDGDANFEETVAYRYNTMDKLSGMNFPNDNFYIDGQTLLYEYDAKGRMTRLAGSWQENGFVYDNADRHIATYRAVNGLISEYSHDLAGRLLELTHSKDSTTLAQFQYAVDGRGNRVQANERVMNPDTSLVEQTIVYDYDTLSRLASAQYRDGFNVTSGTPTRDLSYGYDLAGNLVNKNGVTRIYNSLNQLEDVGSSQHLTYDANGNLIDDGVNTYVWDRANRMVSGPGSTSYKYDGLGNRIQQTVNLVVTNYLNDVQPGLTKLLTTTTDDHIETFVHGPRGIHARILPYRTPGIWGQAKWGHSIWGEPTGSGDPGQYLLEDGLGSVRAEVDIIGDILANAGYDPYGVPIDLHGSSESPYGFTGEQTDANGQVYLRARYYTPSMAIFTALDPWEGIPQRPMSLNGYSWVEGNTPNMVDPSGMQCCSISDAECQNLSNVLDTIQSEAASAIRMAAFPQNGDSNSCPDSAGDISRLVEALQAHYPISAITGYDAEDALEDRHRQILLRLSAALLTIDRKLASSGLGSISTITNNRYRIAFNYDPPLEGKVQLSSSAEYLMRLGNQMFTSYIVHEWGHLFDRDVSLAHSDYLFTPKQAVYLFDERVPSTASVRVVGIESSRQIAGSEACVPYNEEITDYPFQSWNRYILSGSYSEAPQDFQRCLIGYGDIANDSTSIGANDDLRREDWADMFMNWVYDGYPSDRGAGFDKAAHHGARGARRIWINRYTTQNF